MDTERMKRKDTTKGPPLRILSLDGGGVRGYSIFVIIQEIMHRTFVEIEGRAPRRSEIPKPADHFDLIVGTGTGGLVALMLGRLRLDLETCKELYVRLTRMVFETDKTILGIPTRSTLFKASMLELAIKEAVREHTVDEYEGNDGSDSPASPASMASRNRLSHAGSYPRRHASNASVVSFSHRSPTSQFARPAHGLRGGNPDASLYDARENRTKTVVTAIYRGTQKGGDPALLRSYDSRKEPSPEYDCKIWEAGRATCAIGLAFKPIKIGQSVFHDDGAGTFNPAIQALDEAVVNEWPGRDVGVFISVGTGRRPKSSDANQSLWYEGFLGDFADARKRLIAKIEGCETIHQYVKREHLLKRGVNVENYYRLNVEMGVGEFGMNEWNRLADISTSTRQYLRRPEESAMVQGSAAKLAKIYRAKMRHDRMSTVPDVEVHTTSDSSLPTFAVELPGDMPTFPTKPQNTTPSSRQSYDSGPDSLGMPTSALSPRSSGGSLAGDRPLPPPPPASATGAQPSYTRPSVGSPPSRPTHNPTASTVSAATVSSMGTIDDDLLPAALTPTQWKSVSGQDKIAIVAQDEQPRRGLGPPPLPPKTPIPENHVAGGGRRPPTNGKVPPYPMDDEPPPAVNMAMKPRV
ncbi:hypothetical protein MCOR27_005669 [Pyricularia oryzae]|uniref:Uncharacterized protein n=1 Tax=Pyricularia oryzae TaxID=318829 RepID=A0A4P7N9V8_PYROR|nr:hypothetical protein MCOR01_008671 [Pyricularia oryzae]KAH9439325.1 hypothetical protein MCOR02_002887 [Pyricularia oryzae]KAI6256867.1 hypothetical protein MCOR19_006686 [Pyricularia oryzae]KAI6275140.1 hypothetical protein MCOR26_006197 [Pyricularia oryzae]KAI6278367.1 hypothetical protein MCOR27_005669 [Pyricularia oryzae]